MNGVKDERDDARENDEAGSVNDRGLTLFKSGHLPRKILEEVRDESLQKAPIVVVDKDVSGCGCGEYKRGDGVKCLAFGCDNDACVGGVLEVPR